jgi:hypothetical protein
VTPLLERSLVRRALEELLRRHPMLDLLAIDWQVDPADERQAARWRGSWVLVELGQPSDTIAVEPAWAVWRFAIWRSTGAVHIVGAGGAVSDDPIFVPHADR